MGVEEQILLSRLIIKSIGSIFNTALPAAEANLFSSDMAITETGTVRITFQATVAGVLRVAITRSGTTKTLNLNSNSNLAASAIYSFDIPVKASDTVNLRYSNTGGTTDYCEVQFFKVVS